MIDIIVFIIIALVLGGIGALIAGFRARDIFITISIGFFGAMLGIYAVRWFSLPPIWVYTYNGTNIPIIWGVLGAALFIYITTLLKRRNIKKTR